MFEWQTEDDTPWENEAAAHQPAEPVRRRWPWWLLVMGVTAVVLGLWTVYRQVQAEVAERTTAVEQELLATHRFVWDIAARQESDLFRDQLSGRDPRWMEDQIELVQAGLFLHRPALGLTAVLPAASQVLTTTLNPELTAAEVTAVYSYTVLDTAGMTETVQLQQTAVYRLGQNRRWLLAPPLESFWGEWKSHETPYLTLIYPQRDTAVAERLADDLNDLLRRACRELADLDCPAEAHLQVRFSDQLENLLQTADSAPWAQPEYALELPTPTLVGLPQDEAGYQVLYRVYGSQVVSAFISSVVGYSCCGHLPIFQVLLHHQLHDLGLRRWPLTPESYEQISQTYNTMIDGRAWNQSTLHLKPIEWLQLYALVVYVLETADTTPAHLQQTLTTAQDYLDWLLTAFPDVDNVTYLDAHLQQYIYLHSATGLKPLPLPLPNQKIALSCRDDQGATTLYEYNFAEEQWAQVFSRSSQENGYYGAAFPLPNGSGYAIQEEWDGGEGQHYSRISLWRPDEEVTVLERHWTGYGVMYLTNWWGNYPENHWLLNATTPDGSMTELWLFDPTRCHTGQCDVKQLVGWPTWSADTSQTLLTIPQADGHLQDVYLGDAWGQPVRQVGQGGYAYWLDNERYVYYSQVDGGAGEWVWASVQDETPHLLFTAEMFLAQIPEERRPLSLTINYIMADPSAPRLLVVGSSDNNGSGVNHLFLWQEGQITLLNQTDDVDWAVFSPNGRWFYLARNNRYGTLGSVELYDQENEKRAWLDVDQFFWPSWSADEEWMMYNNPDENAIRLHAPAYNYHRLIPYTMTNCFNYPLWVGLES